jgi:hypothetical protein
MTARYYSQILLYKAYLVIIWDRATIYTLLDSLGPREYRHPLNYAMVALEIMQLGSFFSYFSN